MRGEVFLLAKTIDFTIAQARKQQIIAEARQHQHFSSVQQMDRSVRAFLAVHGPALSSGTVAVLRFVTAHSCKVVGVCWARVDYIARKAGVSRRTVQRALNVLEAFGIIKRVPTQKANGQRGVNLIVIQPFYARVDAGVDAYPKPEKARQEAKNKRSQHVETKGQAVKTKHEEKNVQETNEKATLNIPLQFVRVAKQNGQSAVKLWTKVRLAARKMGLDPAAADIVQVAVKTLRHNLRSLRDGKVYGDFMGYFYRSMIHQLAVYRRRMNASLFDWLGASKAAAEAVAAVQEVAAAVAHQEQMEASGGYEERQERRIADDPELLALLMELEARKNGLSA